MTQLTREQRAERRTARATLLREFADKQFTLKDMLEIFGRALMAKIAAPTERHNTIGKHYYNRKHGQKHRRKHRRKP